MASRPKTRRLAGGRKEQAEQQLDRGRFAGAVRAEQAEDFAAMDRQIEGLQRPNLLPAPKIAIDLREISGFDDHIVRGGSGGNGSGSDLSCHAFLVSELAVRPMPQADGQ